MFKAEARAHDHCCHDVATYDRNMDTPQLEHTEPGLMLGERPALEAWLDFHYYAAA
jgi:hypothetical protein